MRVVDPNEGKISDEFPKLSSGKSIKEIDAATVIPKALTDGENKGFVVIPKNKGGQKIGTWILGNGSNSENSEISTRANLNTIFDDNGVEIIDAIFVYKDVVKDVAKDVAYIFSEKNVFEWISREQIKPAQPFKEHDKFKGLPFDRVDAVFLCDYDGVPETLKNCAYFFSGDEYAVWCLEEKKLKEKGKIEDEFKIKDESKFSKVDAACILSSGGNRPVGYLFYGDKYYKFFPPIGIEIDQIRFNKCPPIKEDDKAGPAKYDTDLYINGVLKDEGFYPLNYPLNDKNAQKLKEKTNADSVVIIRDPDTRSDLKTDEQVKIFVTGNDELSKFESEFLEEEPVFKKYLKLKNQENQPAYPGTEQFWEELKEVVDRQLERLDSANATELYWPRIWYERKENTKSNLNPFPPDKTTGKTLTLEDIAQSVKGDYSNYHQQTLIKTLFMPIIDKDDNLASLKKKPTLNKLGQQERSATDFIGMELRMATLNAWTLEAVGPLNFGLKWFYGMPRPEEVMWLLHKGSIAYKEDEGLKPSEELTNKIKELADKAKENLEAEKARGKVEKEKNLNATHFTAYLDDGSPTHPSFPAMHSAGSTLSLWLPVVYNITDDQYLEALKIDYAVAYARTVAGVHYPQDNIAGLNAGQTIIAEKLPKFLADNYGYDQSDVKDKIKSLTFDWNDVKFKNVETQTGGTEEVCVVTDTQNHKQFLAASKSS